MVENSSWGVTQYLDLILDATAPVSELWAVTSTQVASLAPFVSIFTYVVTILWCSFLQSFCSEPFPLYLILLRYINVRKMIPKPDSARNSSGCGLGAGHRVPSTPVC